MTTPDDRRAQMDEFARRSRHEWAPGTITRSVTDSGFTSEVEVVMDADLTGQSIPVSNLMALPLAAGVRVMVAFNPPNGAAVIGVVGGSGPIPVGRLDCADSLDGGKVVFLCVRMLDGGMDETAMYQLDTPFPGIYSVTGRVWVNGACDVYLATTGGSIIDHADTTGAACVSLAAAATPVIAEGISLQVIGAGVVNSHLGSHLSAHYVAPYRQDDGCGSCGGA